MNWWALVVIALASYRATKLIVSDKIWWHARVRLKDWLRSRTAVHDCDDPDLGMHRVPSLSGPSGPMPIGYLGGKIADLISCVACSGLWVTVALAALWHTWPMTRPAVVVLAACGVQALLSSWEG